MLLCMAHAQDPHGKAITLYNLQAVEPEPLEQIRAFAQQDLRVPVRAREEAGPDDVTATPDAMAEWAQGIRAESDVLLIVLTRLDRVTEPLTVHAGKRLAVVNVSPLETDDAGQFARRVERMVMRGVAFAIGLPPTPDPFCVTRDFRHIEELDRMGRNYSPPWQGRFAEKAAAIGLERAPGVHP